MSEAHKPPQQPSHFTARLLDTAALTRLPVEARICDRLTEILVLTDELLAEVTAPDAGAAQWLQDDVRRIYAEIESVLSRYAQ